MSISYRHIQEYENFITRYNKKQNKIAAGIAIKRKGRPQRIMLLVNKIRLQN